MAEVIEEITRRRARRAIDENKPVPRETVDRMIESAHLAASCSNKQPWRYLIGDEGEVRETLRAHLLGGNYWAKKAPVLIAVATRERDDCRLNANRNYALFDTGMATAHLILQGTREGLYVHPMAGFDAPALKEALGLDEEVILITVIAVGYAGSEDHLSEKHLESEHSERSRMPVENVASRSAFPFE